MECTDHIWSSSAVFKSVSTTVVCGVLEEGIRPGKVPESLLTTSKTHSLNCSESIRFHVRGRLS